MNDYEITFYNIYTRDARKIIISAANCFCACKEALELWDKLFITANEWVLNNMTKLEKPIDKLN